LIRKELRIVSLSRKLDMGWHVPSFDWLFVL
jgi:hypothetical protein